MYIEKVFKNEEEFFQWNIENENEVIKEEDVNIIENYCYYLVKNTQCQEIHCRVNNYR